MEATLWFCLAVLVSSWGRVRYWRRLEDEQVSLRPERNMVLARWPMLLVVVSTMIAAFLPRGLHAWLGYSGDASTLLGDFMPLILFAVFLFSGIPALPIRRRLLGETWSVWAYLDDQLRLLLSFFTGALLLLFLPMIALSLDAPWGGMAAVSAGIVLNVWLWLQGGITARLLRAAPLDSSAHQEACEALLLSPELRLDGRKVTITAAGHPDGGLINAVAASGLKRCHILISRRMPALLSPEETAAICAHELAHLEWRNRRWLLRFRGVWLLLTLAGLALPFLVPNPAWWLPGGWLLAVLLLLIFLQRRQRGEEAACDARALELGANPSALMSGLIKLHQAGLVPRRLSASVDQSMTHPSLARRLQAIRELAKLPDPPSPTSLSFETAKGRLQLDGEGLSHTVQSDEQSEWHKSFSRLIELYLTPLSKGTRLILREAEGPPIQISLKPADLAPLQNHLDQVDHRFAPLPDKTLGIERWTPLIALTVLLAMYGHLDVITPYQQLLLVIPAIFLIFLRLGSALLLLSVMAVGLAFVIALEPTAFGFVHLLSLLGLGGVGLWGLWLLRTNHHRFQSRSTVIMVAICLLLTIYAWLDVAIRPWDPALFAHLHSLGGERASLLLPLLALGMVLIFAGKRKRILGTVVGTASLLLLILTSTSLYPMWNTDHFDAVSPSPLPAARAVEFEERSLPGKAYGLRVSSGDGHFMAWLEGERNEGQWKLALGGFDGGLMETVASDGAFHDGQWLVARRETDHTMLALMDAEAQVTWSLRLPALGSEQEFSLWVEKGTWSLNLWDRNEQWAGIYQGRIGSAEWRFDKDQPKQADNGEKKCVGTTMAPWQIEIKRGNGRASDIWRPWRRGLLRRGASISRVQISGPKGEKREFTTSGIVNCMAVDNDFRRLCLAYNRNKQTRFLNIWMFDGKTGRFSPKFSTKKKYRFGYGNSVILLFTKGRGEQQLLLVSTVSASPLVLKTVGAPFSELQLHDNTIYGLRTAGRTTAVARLVLPGKNGVKQPASP